METSKQMLKTLSVGDAAVEGLMYGIVAGLAMALFVVAFELLGGIAPQAVLSYFDVGSGASPLVGLFTHVAVSGMYGVVFGIAAMLAARTLGAHMTLGKWLALGLLYGAVVFGVAIWIVLPRTNSPLSTMPMWAFAIAHFLYGGILGWLVGRSK